MILLSGPQADRVVGEIFRPSRAHAEDCDGALRLGRLVDDHGDIDEAIVTRRGEAYEINIHGGPAVARAALTRLSECGVTVAPQGTTRESFPPAHPKWNNPAIGREMLNALQKAHSSLVISAISQQWSAGLSKLARSDPSADALRLTADRLPQMIRLCNPPEVVLAGEPNVGKSTLTNALIGRPVSIIHDQAGTTRDWVRELAVLDGVPVWLTDTAGLWKAHHQVDAEAVRRACECIESADLTVLLQVGADGHLPSWLDPRRTIRVAAKIDAAPPTDQADVSISARTGEGLDELRHTIVDRLGLGDFQPAAPAAFSQRQAELLRAAADKLDADDADTAADLLSGLLRG